ncbi:MAG: endonuclease domain-containing protein [Myxococcaceae bacterium]
MIGIIASMERLTCQLVEHARTLRSDQTKAEQIVWSALRNRRFLGLKWRRQVPWRGYILDFYCAELFLALELDGSQHSEPEHAARDELRRRSLQAAGVKVLRFSNADVLFALKDVFGVINAEKQRRGEEASWL